MNDVRFVPTAPSPGEGPGEGSPHQVKEPHRAYCYNVREALYYEKIYGKYSYGTFMSDGFEIFNMEIL